MLRHLIWVFVVLTAGILLLASCSSSGTPSGQPTTPAGSSAPTTAAPAAGATTASQPKGTTLAEILPAGNGLTLLLNNCSSCHSVVCSVKGQRPVDRWESLKQDHRDKTSGLSEADLNTLFSYLSANFNNTKPEPNLPPELAAQGGCTPF
ncbi:MAG: hypothetical protein HW374_1844 [Bacteroidetes bacterium]|nr:hypothetical protein [Bacteroidota bacterium]